ncbi:MAG: glycosyltransferase family 4 protein [Lewinellaceae bacterium]|nr:glycosyltransferase family 4 protein [Saprospiraceae bacterium]MCB9338345.1 glycosyltransferase family 4 protein [Lewinellaceae bacterium]
MSKNHPNTIVSCAAKLHAFALSEQLEKHGLLTALYTSYAYQKNTLMRRFTSRVDKEQIPPSKIHTALPVAIMMQRGVEAYVLSEHYDKWVARKLARRNDYQAFIGWSGMSLHALRQAKKDGKTTIIERGSSHIAYQDRILHEEFKRFDIHFNVDARTIEKELQEYEEADYISIPSGFVKNSFLEMGVSEDKLIHNPYGTASHFKKPENGQAHIEGVSKGKFRVLYLGSLMIRKGLAYMFEAIRQLNIPEDQLEIWFIGKVDDDLKQTVEKYTRPNWKFFGHMNYYDLPKYIAACDVAVQPSLEEGLSMVIPQIMGCGVPVIATTNTGGEDVISDGENGFIVPIKDPAAIAGKIERLFEDKMLLGEMKAAAAEITKRDFSWDNYGERYAGFLRGMKTEMFA